MECIADEYADEECPLTDDMIRETDWWDGFDYLPYDDDDMEDE